MKKVAIFFHFIVFSLKAFADDELLKKEASQMLGNGGGYEPNYFSMIFGLFVVVCLIYLTGYIYQRLIKINLKSENNELNNINIVSTTSLGQGRNLHIIKINGEYSLIGATQNNITHIKELKNNESVEVLKDEQ